MEEISAYKNALNTGRQCSKMRNLDASAGAAGGLKCGQWGHFAPQPCSDCGALTQPFPRLGDNIPSKYLGDSAAAKSVKNMSGHPMNTF